MPRSVHSIGLLFVAMAFACSSSAEREPVNVEDIVLPDAGVDARISDGGSDTDADEVPDDADVLEPSDADRGEHGGQCFADQECVGWLHEGPCERAVCNKGLCAKEALAEGTPCDDGNACTVGDSCKGGYCSFDSYSPGQPGCATTPAVGSIWFSEIMGNPADVPGTVDSREGQWIEIIHRGANPLFLGGLKLVYYEWAKGSPEPPRPSAITFALAPDSTDEVWPTLLLRSHDPTKNGMLSARWSYSDIIFSKVNTARLALVKAEWDGTFPIPVDLVIDELLIDGGTFDDAHRGQSWQLSWPFPDDPAARQWCHAPAHPDGHYATNNYATPQFWNATCAP